HLSLSSFPTRRSSDLDFIVFLRPVDLSHWWKSYYWSFYSGRSNLSLPTSGIIGNPGTPAKNFFNLMAAEEVLRRCPRIPDDSARSEEHTSELQSRSDF